MCNYKTSVNFSPVVLSRPINPKCALLQFHSAIWKQVAQLVQGFPHYFVKAVCAVIVSYACTIRLRNHPATCGSTTKRTVMEIVYQQLVGPLFCGIQHTFAYIVYGPLLFRFSLLGLQ